MTTKEFSLQLLKEITDNFSEKHIIGHGGYGVVYKQGVLADGEEIALKRLYPVPGLDDTQFTNEFNNLMKAQHPNVTRLIGYCYNVKNERVKLNDKYVFAHSDEKVLCFEYLKGGSLDKHISDESCGLNWHTRFKIIKGICEGLNYLHNGSKDPIYHLDLKPENIMLDENMVPKIGDFGLSRLFPSARTYVTIKVIGTIGYMPPEFIERREITSKFDIFSLGVTITRIVAGYDGYSKCARMSLEEFIKHVHENWEKRLQDTMSSYTPEQVTTCIKIALSCVENTREKRPNIAEIVDKLNMVDTTESLSTSQIAKKRSWNSERLSFFPVGARDVLSAPAGPFSRLSPLGAGATLAESTKMLGCHVYSKYFGSRKARERWWRSLLVLWIIGSTLASFHLFHYINSNAVEKRRDSLASMCDERARMLQDQFNVSMNHLHALAILVNTFHHSGNPSSINQVTFATYMERTAFERPLTSGVAYAVRVTHAERDQFERQQGWSIKKMYSPNSQGEGDAAGAMIREPDEEYAPVIFAQDAYKNVISFDMLSGADDRENIIRARESGRGALTAPFQLLNGRIGVILTYSVYTSEAVVNARPQELIQAAIGYLGAIIDMEALVDKLLHQLAGKQSIMVNVYDTTYEYPIRMYGSNDKGSGMYHNSSLNFGDPSRRHVMHCRWRWKDGSKLDV
ncbi:hypothetical protein CFC21_081771 [Triticum aestivum]|uniref:Protein kinase domain-containing protein n=2 Tax=Triticum aestivum TaxID=4565 RepID=A0A9R1I4V6_WHEAT|nr:hypothetical protein CFC21_081770 [Triticum aestivum]KAF7077193.1 hypothetical protein CFC21_081771 [Triticum aestivum]